MYASQATPKFYRAAQWELPGDEAPGDNEVFICDSLTNLLQNKINPSQNGSNSYLVDKPFMRNI